MTKTLLAVAKAGVFREGSNLPEIPFQGCGGG